MAVVDVLRRERAGQERRGIGREPEEGRHVRFREQAQRRG